MEEEEKERKKVEEMRMKKIPLGRNLKRKAKFAPINRSMFMQAPPEEEEEDLSEIIVLDTGMFSVKVCSLTST